MLLPAVNEADVVPVVLPMIARLVLATAFSAAAVTLLMFKAPLLAFTVKVPPAVELVRDTKAALSVTDALPPAVNVRFAALVETLLILLAAFKLRSVVAMMPPV